MIQNLLKNRGLPELRTRREMLDLLQREEYGLLPALPQKVTFDETRCIVPKFCAGKAELFRVDAHCTLENGTFSFPFFCAMPERAGKFPFFVHINFRPDIPDRYMPTEELIDNGFAVFSFCCNDVTADNADFTDGLAGILFPDGRRTPSDPGKIAMWAWAAQRVMDYAQTRTDKLDLARGIVCGHSRLGKTALLTAAADERFAFAYSNNSGCSGDSLFRGNTGEQLEDIARVFPYWFCEKFRTYAGRVNELPFDQHYLLACIAPRYVCVGSAAEDAWADPVSQRLCCSAANDAFTGCGVTGFAEEDRPARIGDKFFDGHIGFHKRAGLHYFSREDWNRLIEFVKLHTE